MPSRTAGIGCSFFFFSSRRRHTRCLSDWSSDVCSSDLFTLNVLGNYYFNFRVSGEPTRLLPELDMIYIMTIVYFLRWLWNRPQVVWRGLAIVLVGAAFWTTHNYLLRAWDIVPAWPDHTNRVEYRITDWIWK